MDPERFQFFVSIFNWMRSVLLTVAYIPILNNIVSLQVNVLSRQLVQNAAPPGSQDASHPPPPLSLIPEGFHLRVVWVMFFWGFHGICPIHFHFLLLTVSSIWLWHVLYAPCMVVIQPNTPCSVSSCDKDTADIFTVSISVTLGSDRMWKSRKILWRFEGPLCDKKDHAIVHSWQFTYLSTS